MKCPECESTEITTHSDFPHYVPYTGGGEVVTVCYEAPSMECRKCGLMYDGEVGQKTLDETIAKYRRAFTSA
jgi:rubredoxin